MRSETTKVEQDLGEQSYLREMSRLAKTIREEHAGYVAQSTSTALHAARAGEALKRAKERLRHDEWLNWLEENCNLKARTAQEYMRLASNLPFLETKAHDGAHLTIRDVRRLLGSSSIGTSPVSALRVEERQSWRQSRPAQRDRQQMPTPNPNSKCRLQVILYPAKCMLSPYILARCNPR